MLMYIAHINEKDDNYQSVEEHSYNVAKLAEAFSIQPMGNVVFNAGLFHDVGKFQALFQRRISGEDVRVEHSGCGAQLCVKNYPNSLLGFVMAYCIAGHHSGLPNGGSKNDTADMATLYGRIEREYEDYSAWKGSLSAKPFSDSQFISFLTADCNNDKRKIIDKLAFWIRYCFSCLTDADTIDSAGFCGEDIVAPMKTDFKRCLMRLNEHFNSFEAHTVLQKKRSAIQAQVFDGVQQSGEIYTINMPTGSGKTLCSVKFALEKAIAAGKKRIIYVIPYNSIIDQTASVFEGIFGRDMELLRHQSTFSYSDDEQYSSEYSVKAKYNSENWQADFIITTAVQFFETICSHQKSRLRKLHNMADSIIVFDEVHQLPLKYLRPCLQAVTCVTKYLNAQAVFMTATMPDFRPLLEKYSFANTNVVDLVRDKKDFIYFRKCHYDFWAQQDREFIVQQALEAPSALIIVNKRQTARDIFSLCTGEKYHLSTYMTARDRERTISKIKMRLSSLAADYPDWKNVPPERRICVVSTSLIEAGVDLDFYTVYRELTGLDSILQAGGRCNREGHREYGDVHIFELPDSGNDDIKTNLTRSIIEKYEVLDSEEAIEEYYHRLFAINDQQIDKMGMSGEKGAAVNTSIPFQDIDMNMIDSPTISLVVMQDEACRKMIEGLRLSGRANVRSLQKYTCTIYCYELEQLSKQGVVDDCNGIIWLTDEKYYDEKIGIIFEGRDYIVGDEGDIMSIIVPSEGGGIIL